MGQVWIWVGGLRLILEMERKALRVVGVSFDIWRNGLLKLKEEVLFSVCVSFLKWRVGFLCLFASSVKGAPSPSLSGGSAIGSAGFDSR